MCACSAILPEETTSSSLAATCIAVFRNLRIVRRGVQGSRARSRWNQGIRGSIDSSTSACLYQLSISIPLPTSGISSPAVLATTAIIPLSSLACYLPCAFTLTDLVVIVNPPVDTSSCSVLPTAFDLPLTAWNPMPFRSAIVDVWKQKAIFGI